MNTKVVAVLLSGAAMSIAGVATRADDDRNPPHLPTHATFTTLTVTDSRDRGADRRRVRKPLHDRPRHSAG
jgi:hypothetical protein